MLKVFAVIVLTCGAVFAQNSNSSTTTTERPRTTNTNRAKPAATPKKQTTPVPESGSEGVLAAFNTLLNGIRHASVDEVMSAYWNSAQLNLFNYNEGSGSLPITSTQEVVYRVDGPGQGNESLIRIRNHATLNANGTVTVAFDEFSAECLATEP